MKKTNIIGLVLIAVCIGVIIAVAGDFSQYESFETALNKSPQEVIVVGQLDKDLDMNYDPETDPNYFEFYAKDKDSVTQKVIFYGPMPQDFTRSEQITLTGVMKDDAFHANKILMKCPSKYVEDELEVTEVKAES